MAYKTAIIKDDEVTKLDLSVFPQEDFEITAKCWITVAGEPFLGHGRVLLLEKIKECGSISAAARTLNMAYRRAWWHIEAMNRLAGTPLIETSIGGKGGGGATLTHAGEIAIILFRLMDEKTEEFQKELGEELKTLK